MPGLTSTPDYGWYLSVQALGRVHSEGKVTRVAVKSTPDRLGPTVTSRLAGEKVYSASDGVTV